MVTLMVSRKEALRLLDEGISNNNLKKHMIVVSAIMQGLARKFGEDEEVWALTGLLHDIDYERVEGNMDKHGLVSAEMLMNVFPEEFLHAIRAHNARTGVKAESLLDKALLSADAVSGLIVAAALVMPNKKLSEVRVETLKTKFKDKSFARGVDRGQIEACGEMGLKFEEFLEIALKALQGVSDQLGL